MYEWILWCCSH